MGDTTKNRAGAALQGTLDLLVLSTLRRGPLHGFAIASRILQGSGELLRVEEGSLYPALHRLEQNGLLASEWNPTDKGRRARFYRLTESGMAQLEVEEERWDRLARGVAAVLQLA
jgi:PadR family transcriptional regulator